MQFKFTDRSGNECTLYDSSLATEPAIRLGVVDEKDCLSVTPRVHPREPNGSTLWEKVSDAYPEIKDIVGTVMLLTVEQTRDIIPLLQSFVDNGMLPPVDGDPTEINEEGIKIWRNKKGFFHREYGPAIIFENGEKRWYFNGRLHRGNGPAVVYPDGSGEYFMHGARVTKPKPESKPGPEKPWYFNHDEKPDDPIW